MQFSRCTCTCIFSFAVTLCTYACTCMYVHITTFIIIGGLGKSGLLLEVRGWENDTYVSAVYLTETQYYLIFEVIAIAIVALSRQIQCKIHYQV